MAETRSLVASVFRPGERPQRQAARANVKSENTIVWQCADVGIRELRVRQFPRHVSLLLESPGREWRLALVNPEPLSALVGALDDLHSIQVVDESIEKARQLEFARFRVELRCEEGACSVLRCDSVEIGEPAP